MVREIRLCNNNWKFTHEEWNPDNIKNWEQWTDIGLPHSFGIPYFMENEFYVGHGSYAKEIVLSKKDLQKRILLEFFGSFQVTEGYLNGEFIGRHEGGYTSFAFDLTGRAVEGVNLLFVKVNNLWDARIAPRGGEHQFNGGIYRDVQLVLTSRTCVERLGTFVKTESIRDKNARLSLETELVIENPDDCIVLESIIFSGDTELFREEVTVDAKRRDPVRQEATLPDVLTWTPKTPYLYRLISLVKCNGEIMDECSTTFGIRSVRFDKNQGFFLNGEHYNINGANVHQDHAGWADAVTRSSITRDIQMIKDCGMNFIRGSHYPHHTFFADECDRIGILFWSELCYWGTAGPKVDGYWYSSAYPIREEDEEAFQDNCMQTLEEMIRENRNNPSVIIWSVSNEPFFSAQSVMEKARIFTSKLVDRVHELDPTRPAAVGGAQRGGFDVLGDVAGYNGDGASLFIDPGFPNFVSEYGSRSDFRPGEFFPNYTDNVDQAFLWRSGKALWCAFHHGSIIGDMGAMGMIDYYRLPLNTWHWYRQELLGIPSPQPRRPGIPFALRMSSSTNEIQSNGQEDAHIIVEVLDEDGNSLSNEFPVALTILEGDGIFPTGKQIMFTPENKSFLDGQAAIEFRSYYGGVNIIEASADGVKPCRIQIIALGEPRKRILISMTPPPYITPAPSFQMKYNLSINKPVFVSSYQEGHEPTNVTMGNDSCWMPKDENAPWLMLDLEGTRTIHGIEVFLVEEQSAECCVVQLSKDDGSCVEQVLPALGQGYGTEGEWSFRYIRINLNEGLLGIREIRLWLKQ